MPGLGNLLMPRSSAIPDLAPCPEFKTQLDMTLFQESDTDALKLGTHFTESHGDAKQEEFKENGEQGVSIEKTSDSGSLFREGDNEDGEGTERALRTCRVKAPTMPKLVQEWSKRKIEQGIPEFECSLPFLVGAPKLVQCGVCQNAVYPEEKILCSVRGCRSVFHLTCAKQSLNCSLSKQFKCPQHACFLCKQKNHMWRCTRCSIACHDKCVPFPEYVIHFPDRPTEAICWRHPTDWRLEKDKVPANNLQDIFFLLPLPYNEEEFKLDINWKNQTETKSEPDPYVHIKRNVYLVKRRRNNIDADIGCTSCSSTQCSDGCVCRVQCISCSKACRCSKTCTNRPFQKVKKIQIVKTERCGWGVVAAEPINKRDFIVEYVGEVIDDALCERRLWDMKDQDAKNFYMCEINKDFVIDATFKGNASRFLNHSCAPNCKLEKWQVEGETRVGVFASRAIKVGEPLTYDYRFVQFGPEVECHCGAPNCHGYLGTKRKILFSSRTKMKLKLDLSWGPKRRRTTKKIVGIVTN